MFNKLNKYIEKIKQKPEHVRIKYVWGLTIFCTFLIFIVWASTLKSNFTLNREDLNDSEINNDQNSQELINSINGDISTLKDDLFNSINEGSNEGLFEDEQEENLYDEEARKSQKDLNNENNDQDNPTPNETDTEDTSDENIYQDKTILNQENMDPIF